MNKKKKQIVIHEASGSKNWLRIDDSNIERLPEITVILHNHEGILVTRHEQLKKDDISNSAEIILNFANKNSHNHVNEGEVEYYLVSKPKNAEEKEKIRKEIHQNYIIENNLVNSGGDKNDIIWAIKHTDNQIVLEISKQGDAGAGSIKVRGDKLKIRAKFYLVDEVELDDVLEYLPTGEEKSRWTTGWIIFVAILAVILLLIAVFWKKIWKWFRGEREQEKKVREQIDIF